MDDIGLKDIGISPVAVAGPFPLFSGEAVKAMEKELLSTDVPNNCRYGSGPSFRVWGACPDYAKISDSIWKHRQTLETISLVAEVSLTIVMDIEICHTNVHQEENNAEGEPIIGWHKDGYPFVCIVMLSDTSSMVGGCLELKGGTGDIITIPKMEQGSAIILQGRHIKHRVSYCANRRVTAVTSFRPFSSFLQDDTRLTTAKAISPRSRLYYEFFIYRESVVIIRLEEATRILSEEPESLRRFLDELAGFLQQTKKELWDGDIILSQCSGATRPRMSNHGEDLMSALQSFLLVLVARVVVEVGQSRISSSEGLVFDKLRSRQFITGQLESLEEMKNCIQEWNK
ncbi:MAG: hypothetical protein M1840_007605 [Geoglossum simile]|nr:MAG: hypothetical protein M1840_007605 [Geoglossum simile]